MHRVAETRRGRPTMNDVAATAGVALKTVSRVVNDEPGVNAATAERVRQAIERLGYRRNEGARVLRRGRTATIGLIIEDVADPFYSGLSRAVEDVARSHGSLVFTGSSGEDPRRERELVLAFCARRVDGLVVVPAGSDHAYLGPELAAGIRAVFADRPAGPDVDVDTVLCDNTGGARSGVAHLIAHGHRRIGFVGDSAVIFTAAERHRGFRQGLEAAGVPYDASLVAMGPPDQARVDADVARLMTGPHPPTALLTGNGRTTLTTLRALARYPSRVALVGFDDFDLADLLVPAVTVVAQDPPALGRTSAELLFRRLSGDNGPTERVELPTRLIPRGSGELPPAP
ncbi:LacI family DNA-binding transcriptional regulator [Sphaerisporangium sp. TRM90804]|uniref:LacI family DNA-binding transcriptional regulator n=1 Tax=Sphaerisporangium sp. TRM90804 TaxID=3031113 RepID=UPI00244711C0|nr:LacI family DNA-binding transcriptional regulator [Sphaerisporangium sp. TRM90804]MDH2427551.1 LacI family DNA-binding transcriptional regulator [Sphaerisporangium sp. TRM90804]